MSHLVTIPEYATMSTIAGGIQWQCQSQWHAKIFHMNTMQWSDLANEPLAQLVKQNAKRKVYRVVIDDVTLFVKAYAIGTIKDRIKNSFRDIPAKDEFTKLYICQDRKISVPTPIAWGINPIGSFCYLICLGVENASSLLDIIRDKDTDDMFVSKALMATAKMISQAHCGGILHQDLHSGNVLIKHSTQSATLIDLQGACIANRSGHPSADPFTSDRVNNFAILIADIRNNITVKQLKAFVFTYLDTLNLVTSLDPSEKKLHLKSLILAADRHDQKIWASRSRRAKRNSTYAQHFKLHGPWRCSATLKSKYRDTNYSTTNHIFKVDDFKETFIQPAALLDDGDILKEGGHSRVIATTINLGGRTLDVVIKKIKHRKGFRGWLQMCRLSKAKREWLTATNLHQRRIPTAWPLCAIERRVGFLLKESILVSEKLLESHTVEEVLSQSLLINGLYNRAHFFTHLGTLFGNLHHKRMVHRDSKASNIMVRHVAGDAIRFEFVDLDGMRPMVLKTSHYEHFALKRFLFSIMRYSKLISSTDIVRLFKAYLVAAKENGCNDRNVRKMFINTMRADVVAYALKKQEITRSATLSENVSDSIAKRQFQNILIIKPSSLGDVARGIPLFHAIKQRYPEAKISWLVRPDCAQILQGLGGLDEIITFDRKQLSKVGRNIAATKAFFNFMKLLRSKQYDLVLDFQGLFRSGLFGWITKAPVRIGFGHAREMATHFYTHKVICYDNEHVVDTMWRFGYLLDFISCKKDFTIDFNNDHYKQATTCLTAHHLSPKQYIVLLIGGTDPLKRWPVEMFSKLAVKLFNSHNLPIVLIGAGETEVALAKTFMMQCEKIMAGRLCVNLVNQTSIGEAAIIIKKSALVCGNDSGPLHIADSFDLPVISIYGPTDPKVVGPYRHMQMVLVPGVNQKRKQRYSLHGCHKIENITVDIVYNAVIANLKGRI